MKIQIGNILKALRKNHKLNQKDLSNILGVSRPTYIRYEQNSIEIPLSKLFELAKFYRIEILELVGAIKIENEKAELLINTSKYN